MEWVLNCSGAVLALVWSATNSPIYVSVVMCYRYVILGWLNGSTRLQRRQLSWYDVEPSLTWHPRCSKTPVVPEQSNMTSLVLAFCCGNSFPERNPMKMVKMFVCQNSSESLYKMYKSHIQTSTSRLFLHHIYFIISVIHVQFHQHHVITFQTVNLTGSNRFKTLLLVLLLRLLNPPLISLPFSYLSTG